MRASPRADRVRAPRRPRLAAIAIAIGIAHAAAAIGGCHRRELPEAQTDAARLYAARCDNCHAVYNPHTLTAAMWQTQVDVMEVKIRAAGLAPLSADERRVILDYLTRNAGTQ
ncbi:MAG TPA: hypothetical protein VEC38_01400 [Candidatus Binataceae bacterium]|nr:hypothetical protein [Candidatus Binataceae bacterium]